MADTLQSYFNYRIPVANIRDSCYEMRREIAALKKRYLQSLPPWEGDSKKLHGVEIEVEGVTEPFFCPEGNHSPAWRITEEGSLRNHGMEFITKPMTGEEIGIALVWLYKVYFPRNKRLSFSSRTSTHIHVDSRAFKKHQFLSFLLLYLAYEKHLFSFGNAHRANGNFCVPLSEILNLSDSTHDMFLKPDAIPFDSICIRIINEFGGRYCALNLANLIPCAFTKGKATGSVEFRHFIGIKDPYFVYDWVRVVSDLHSSAKDADYDKLVDELQMLNTNSEYKEFTKRIFPNTYPLLLACNIDSLVQGVRECKKILQPRPKIKSFTDLDLNEVSEKIKPVFDSFTKQKKETARIDHERNVLNLKIRHSVYTIDMIKLDEASLHSQICKLFLIGA